MAKWETQEDIANEERFASRLQADGWLAEKLNDFYPFDYFAQRGQERAFIEYKRRHHKYGTYSTAFFPAQKFARCRLWARELSTPFSIFLEWDDEIRYCNGMTVRHSISLGGRNDRPRCGKEPMVLLDINDFCTFSSDQ